MVSLFSTKTDDRKLRIELLSGEIYNVSEKVATIDKNTGMVSFDSNDGRVWVPFTNVRKIVLLSKKEEENLDVRAAAKEMEIRAEAALAESGKDVI